MFTLGRVKKITKSNLDYFQKKVYFPFEKPKTLKFLKICLDSGWCWLAVMGVAVVGAAIADAGIGF